MNCPNCGAALPDGSTYCPICATLIQGSQPNAGMTFQQPNSNMMFQQPDGNMMFQQPDGNMMFQQPDGNMMFQQPDGNMMFQQPNGNMMFQQPAPSRRKAAPVGIIISAVVVLAITFLLGFFVLGGRYNGTYMLDPDCKYNGIYMLDSMSVSGYTITASDLASFGMDDIGIKVSFDECSFVGGESLGLGDSDTLKIKFTGNTVTITNSDGTTEKGSVDGNSFTIESDGVEMTFTRALNLTPDDMSKLGIKVSFGKCSLIGKDAFDLGRKPKLKFSNDTVTITTSDGTRTQGPFDGKSFTIELDGVLIRFTKK